MKRFPVSDRKFALKKSRGAVYSGDLLSRFDLFKLFKSPKKKEKKLGVSDEILGVSNENLAVSCEKAWDL